MRSQVSPEMLIEPLPSATLPDPEGDLMVVPEADPPALFFGWAHLGVAKGALAAGKPDEAQREYMAAMALEREWPATRDGRQRLHEISARARIGLAKVALAKNDIEAAFRFVQEGVPWNLPEDVQKEYRDLQEEVMRRRGDER
jgi:hypothetical protein